MVIGWKKAKEEEIYDSTNSHWFDKQMFLLTCYPFLNFGGSFSFAGQLCWTGLPWAYLSS